jgi:hypothetical protein
VPDAKALLAAHAEERVQQKGLARSVRPDHDHGRDRPLERLEEGEARGVEVEARVAGLRVHERDGPARGGGGGGGPRRARRGGEQREQRRDERRAGEHRGRVQAAAEAIGAAPGRELAVRLN